MEEEEAERTIREVSCRHFWASWRVRWKGMLVVEMVVLLGASVERVEEMDEPAEDEEQVE